MAEDAITDEVADLYPFKGVRVRTNDPRAKKKRRPIRVFSFEQMHAFAKAAGRYEAGRTVPVPATLAWMIEAQIQLNGEDCELLFTTPTGRMWRERIFYRDLWKPTQKASGLDIRPHECRHSYVTHLRAAGINDADLAEIAGHRAETMLARYTHAVRQSHGAVRAVIG
jgi:integrase